MSISAAQLRRHLVEGVGDELLEQLPGPVSGLLPAGRGSGRPSSEAGGALHADAPRARGTLRASARRRTCRRSARRRRSGRSGPRRRGGRGRGTSATRRCPPRRAPCGPGRTPSSLAVRFAHRAGRRHPEALLVEPAVGVALQVAGRLVGAGEPRADHHVATRRRPAPARRRAGGARRRRPRRACRARARLGGALEHRGELRPADAGHHPGGAHRARADADLDDVGAGLDRSRTPSAETTLPATTGTLGSSAADRARAPRASAPGGRGRCRRRGTSTPASSSCLGLGRRRRR